MPPLEILPLNGGFLSDAAALVCGRYAALRRATPQLPPRYERPAELLPRLRDMARRAPGAVAMRDGRLVGFLAAYLLDSFRGHPGVFSPEWANGAEPSLSRPVYEALYAHMARQWAAAGYSLHGLSLFTDDMAASEAWRWLGFGLGAADGVRDLRPIGASTLGLAIRRAGPADLDQLDQLDEGLHRHLVAAPVFLPLGQPAGHDELAADLADPAYAFWTAWDGDRAVAFIKFGPASENACAVIHDSGTTSITGAFTRPEARGQGVAAALLDRGLAWAREAGYARCAVDFEPMNTPAARFWTAHFRLVCLSHLRYIDLQAG
ncbi:MAG: GNAT family N-acetyltransferase [Chloroflexales bacterium]|nr:GNAT family N-acetyltransferase [Chloroflexales bacterium]